MLNLKRAARERAAQSQPFSSITPYLALVRPGIVLNKDGSLLATFPFQGQDLDSIGDNEKDMLAGALEHGLSAFDERFTLWWTVMRRRVVHYPGGVFRNEFSNLIDTRNKAKFTESVLYENHHYLSLLYSPPSGVEGFFDRVAFHGQSGERFARAFGTALRESFSERNRYVFDQSKLEHDIVKFDHAVEDFAASVANVKLRRFVLSDLLGFLHSACNPGAAPLSGLRPPRSMMLDTYLHDTALTVGRDRLRFETPHGERYVAAASLKEYPELSRPGMLDALLSIDGEIMVSMAFRFLAQEKAEKLIRSRQRYFVITQKTLLQHVKDALLKTESEPDEGKVAMAQDASQALGAITSHGARYGYYNMTVLAIGNTGREADDTLRVATGAINQAGYLAIRERMGLLSAYAGTLPGQWGEIVRWQMVGVPNIADVAPMRTLSAGEKTNAWLSEQSRSIQPALTALRTLYTTPYYFNFHVDDLGHTMVIGPPGSGKSVFVNFLISQYQKYEPITVIFDKDRSCRIATVLQGGEHIDVVSGAVKLNPLSLLGDRRHWAWIAQWLEILLTSRGTELGADDDKKIFQAIESVASLNPSLWRLSSLKSFLSTHLIKELDAWTEGGQFPFFDNIEDSFSLGQWTCVEMGELLRRFPRASNAFMEYAFYRLDQMVGKGRPAIIYVEECWFMLEDRRFAARLDDWLRTLRKKDVVVVLATQTLTEIERSDYFTTFIDSIPNKIFLANNQAMTHRDVYRRIGLSDHQIARIANAVPKRHYFLVRHGLTRMLDFRLDPESLACLRSDVMAQNAFDRHQAKQANNPLWKHDYLKEVANA